MGIKTMISLLIGAAIAIPPGVGHLESTRNRKELKAVYRVEVERVEAPKALEKQEEKEPLYFHPDVPIEVQLAAYKYGERYKICPELLMAIAWMESRYQGKAENETCIGIMQINYPWHLGRMDRLGITKEDLWDVDANMHVAADYLIDLFEEHNDPYIVLAIYHGEKGALHENYEASAYVLSIMELFREMEMNKYKTIGFDKALTSIEPH